MDNRIALAVSSVGILGLGIMFVAVGQADATPTPQNSKVVEANSKVMEADPFAFPCASKLSGTSQFDYIRGNETAEKSLEIARASVASEWPDATMKTVGQSSDQVTARFDSGGNQIGYVVVNHASQESGWRIDGLRVCSP